MGTVIDAAVDDRDHDRAAAVALALVPGLLGVGIEARGADRRTVLVAVGSPVVAQHLASVVVAPLTGVHGIIGNGGRVSAPIKADLLDVLVLPQVFGQGGQIPGLVEVEHQPAIHAKGLGLVLVGHGHGRGGDTGFVSVARPRIESVIMPYALGVLDPLAPGATENHAPVVLTQHALNALVSVAAGKVSKNV